MESRYATVASSMQVAKQEMPNQSLFSVAASAQPMSIRANTTMMATKKVVKKAAIVNKKGADAPK